MDDSVITYDEINDADVEAKSRDEETKTVPTNFNEKMYLVKIYIYYLLLYSLLNTTALFIDVSICCYLIKYRAKQKCLLPLHVTNNELKEIMY